MYQQRSKKAFFTYFMIKRQRKHTCDVVYVENFRTQPMTLVFDISWWIGLMEKTISLLYLSPENLIKSEKT